MTLDLVEARTALIAMRVKHGAYTPIGMRCSNIVGQLENYESAVACENNVQRDALAKSIEEQMAALERLTAIP